ncbi:MAG: thrombospondin type-1 domain-containing protein, partial [Candidatus Gracilibacteria bacterium]
GSTWAPTTSWTYGAGSCGFGCSPGYNWNNTNQLCSQNIWVSSGWGGCSALCGGGLQFRSVVCQTTTGVTMTDVNCLGVKPIVSQSCNTSSCPITGGGNCIPYTSGLCINNCGNGVTCPYTWTYWGTGIVSGCPTGTIINWGGFIPAGPTFFTCTMLP